MTGACDLSNSEITGPAVLFALNIFGQPLPDHRMAEWYSLEGLWRSRNRASGEMSGTVSRQGTMHAFFLAAGTLCAPHAKAASLVHSVL